MKTYTLKEIAHFFEISPQYLGDIKWKRRAVSKNTAIRISRKTGIPIQKIIFLEGVEFVAFAQSAMRKASKQQKAQETKP